MEFRRLGRTDMNVSAIGFGAWAIGGSWGPVDDNESMRALHASVDAGVNFIDTADVYGDGHSERLIARLKRDRPGEQIWVATKAGRRLAAQTLEGYSRANLESWIDRSLSNLETEALDLLQLHGPHSDVYDSAEVFGYLDGFVQSGKIRYYGVSVETVDEAMRALKHPNVQSVQIIFNMFRLKPQDAFFVAARDRNVGILARVPLASGLLTGKLKLTSRFDADDHRNFNRQGEHFDKGETFSGVPYGAGLQAVEALRALVPDGETMAQWALRWVLMEEAVTSAIPGARTVAQAKDNAAAAGLPPLSADRMAGVRAVYDAHIRPLVHDQW